MAYISHKYPGKNLYQLNLYLIALLSPKPFRSLVKACFATIIFYRFFSFDIINLTYLFKILFSLLASFKNPQRPL